MHAPRCRPPVQRVSEARVPITFELVTAALMSTTVTAFADMRTLNPFLSKSRADAVLPGAVSVLLATSRLQHDSRWRCPTCMVHCQSPGARASCTTPGTASCNAVLPAGLSGVPIVPQHLILAHVSVNDVRFLPRCTTPSIAATGVRTGTPSHAHRPGRPVTATTDRRSQTGLAHPRQARHRR